MPAQVHGAKPLTANTTSFRARFQAEAFRLAASRTIGGLDAILQQDLRSRPKGISSKIV
jgi:hypothetical protein